MKKSVVIMIIAGAAVVAAGGALVLDSGKPKKAKPVAAAQARPAPEAAPAAGDPFGGLGGDGEAAATTAVDTPTSPSLPPELADKPATATAAAAPEAQDMSASAAPSAPTPASNTEPKPAPAAADGLSERVARLESSVAQLAQRLDGRRERTAPLPSGLPVSRLTHEPFHLADGQLRAGIRWTGPSPALSLQRVDAETFELVAEKSLAPNGVPPSNLLDKVAMEKHGADRHFVYRGFGPIDATLVKHGAGRAEIVLSAENGFSGAPRSKEAALEPPAASFESTRWYVRAVTANSAIVYRAADNAKLPVFVGTAIPGCGSVLAIYPETVQVKAECGLLTLAPPLAMVQ